MFKALFFGLSIALLGGIADRALALGALGKTQASYTVKIAGIPVGLLGIAAATSCAKVISKSMMARPERASN